MENNKKVITALTHLLEGNTVLIDGHEYIYQEGRLLVSMLRNGSQEYFPVDLDLGYFIRYFCYSGRTLEEHVKHFIVEF